MKIQTNSLEKILKPAHLGDAGYDVVASSGPRVVGQEILPDTYSHISYIEYDTDLVIAPDSGVHSYIFPRSSISNTNLILANSVGVIDNGYRGTLKFRFKYIAQPYDFLIHEGHILTEIDFDKIYKKGDKIGQIVFSETLTPDLELVETFDDSTRNEGGFGSTGS
jgi:dUTP pyrophosphatase